MSKRWDVILLDEVEQWFFSLDRDAIAAVTGALDLLELEGPTLGRPIVDKVNGSRFHSMKGAAPGRDQRPRPVHLRPGPAGDPAAGRR
ncbi:hypothetical protein MANY_53670 [Mycolicibacterium anyangense]|uniref:Uncharacterized protein n=1 Tax=Mycolicibacterium anyangense TaxID=1431246 RepID=A0A6N4WDG0_9MYCO|nr:hypothetical protein MANY_53670 [Mycolicibacterium anyangense]